MYENSSKAFFSMQYEFFIGEPDTVLRAGGSVIPFICIMLVFVFSVFHANLAEIIASFISFLQRDKPGCRAESAITKAAGQAAFSGF